MGWGGKEGKREEKREKKKTLAKSTVLQCQVYGAVGIGMYGTIFLYEWVHFTSLRVLALHFQSLAA